MKPELQENMEILIEGKYIREIGHNLACPEGTEIIDLSHLTVTPGMIDAHVHPQFFDWTKVGLDTVYNSPGYRALATYFTAEKALYGDMSQTVRDNPMLAEFSKKSCVGLGNGADFFTVAVRREKKLGTDFIKLGFGTDYVVVHNAYENGYEYSAWLNSGVDPFRALQAATKNNAEICEIDHITGILEAGKYADIAGWKRDLLKDPDALRDCSFVMKEGVQYQAQSYIGIE